MNLCFSKKRQYLKHNTFKIYGDNFMNLLGFYFRIVKHNFNQHILSKYGPIVQIQVENNCSSSFCRKLVTHML